MMRFIIGVLCIVIVGVCVVMYHHHRAMMEIIAHQSVHSTAAPRAIDEPTPALERTVERLLESVRELRATSTYTFARVDDDISAITTQLARVDAIATRLMTLADRNIRAREAALATRTTGTHTDTDDDASDEEPALSTGGPTYTDDLTEWPNNVSKANSDQWIVDNHASIRVMRPRLLVINLSRRLSRGDMQSQTRQLIRALAESTSWQGHRRSTPAFLQYQVWKYVNCYNIPIKEHNRWFDYDQLYTEEYARYWNERDPNDASRYLTLGELLDAGYLHEVWMFFDPDDEVHAFESVEWKPVYDENFVRQKGEYRMAGNGGDPDMRWTGRSLRINALNKDRGIGCGTENLGHSMEGMSNARVIPYFTKYFREYAMFDMRERFGVPFDSLYALPIEPNLIRYPDRTTAVVTYQGVEYTITNYVVTGGNVHFPPNARHHYDQENTTVVMSTIESWRQRDGEDGNDRQIPWTTRNIPRRNWDRAPDCMGPWLIYWRQNMPGLDNTAVDDDGKPMMNWWPFLFY